MSMHEILKAAVRLGASDLHLSTGMVPMVRIDGEVVPLEGWTDGPMPAEMTTACIRSILDGRQLAELDKHPEYDFSVGVPEVGRFRGKAYRQSRGPGIALRVIPTRVRTLEELGAPPALAGLMNEGMCTFRRSVLPLVADGRVAAADANEMLAHFEDDEGGPVATPTAGSIAAAQAVAEKAA